MAKYESMSIRNVAVVGHGGTGKTSLCESLMYVAGKTDRPGRVDDGTSSMDYEPEEQKRHISISAAVNFLEWEKHKINIVDTPGDSNFAYDTKNCLLNFDTALIVIDAVGGVEFQTEKVWEYAKEFKLPKVVFINRMDRERADFFKALESIKSRLGDKTTPLFLPIGVSESFKGIVDLLAMKALFFDDPKGAYKTGEIPEEMREAAESYRGAAVEDIAETDEELMDKYLNEGDLSVEDLQAGLKKGIASGTLIPVICGSALKNMGIASLSSMIVNYFPSPVDRGSISGTVPGADKSEERPPDESTPFSARVFKTIADPYAGRLTLFRVYSGSLTSDAALFNATRKLNERVGNIFFLEGKVRKPAEALVPGDVAALSKLKETFTGDTICTEKAPLVFEKITPSLAIMSFAIEPKSRGDEEKIVSSINRLIEEDPTLAFHRDAQTKEMILSGMGQVHIEVTIEKMKRKFGVEVNLKTPKVPYKETIKGKTNVQGKYKK
ncbi:MAG: elongation factor G, partial [Syntrophales bacterium]|nr:elongation factor G [Syntrophales bacterium]